MLFLIVLLCSDTTDSAFWDSIPVELIEPLDDYIPRMTFKPIVGDHPQNEADLKPTVFADPAKDNKTPSALGAILLNQTATDNGENNTNTGQWENQHRPNKFNRSKEKTNPVHGCDKAVDRIKVSATTLTTVNILLSIFCILLSSTVAYFRLKTKSVKGLVQVLYLRNNLADFTVGVGVLLQSTVLVCYICKGKAVTNITVPAFISFSVAGVAVRMSVFMNCVLGLVRCINIVKPFYLVNKRALNVCTIVYMVLCLVIVILDLWWFQSCGWMKNQVLTIKSLVLKGVPGFGLAGITSRTCKDGLSYLGYHFGNSVMFILPTALPALLCFVLMIIQATNLLKKSSLRNTKRNAANNMADDKTKASVTILLLTLIYIATSSVSITTMLVIEWNFFGSKTQFEELTNSRREATSDIKLTMIYFSLSTCSLLCSTLTPLTLLFRGTGAASKVMLRKLFNRAGENDKSDMMELALRNRSPAGNVKLARAEGNGMLRSPKRHSPGTPKTISDIRS